MLENIRSPRDIKNLTDNEIDILKCELRDKIIDTVSKNGGHLASNLGMVDTTVALHRVFNSPDDTIIFDVGHQCYAHKLLTGRYDRFDTLRTFGGLSGFTTRGESEHDALTAGHSGSALPIALGIARANVLDGKDNYVVCVIGDGSFTNGMVYETLNNCNDEKLKLIIVLNDNEMSISQNVGGMAKYFTRLRNSKKYFKLKKAVQDIFQKIPGIGKKLVRGAYKSKEFIKHLLLHTNMFENMGLYYLGPADGNNERKMEQLLEEAKTKDKVTLIHMITLKGTGYEPAEKQPDMYHFAGKFNKDEGTSAKPEDTFSSVFADTVCTLAENDSRIVAVTAAMDKGTGLSIFKEKYPDRFFDVGIAEECAITFAGGLAIGGKVPVCALYSTFFQRAYDQLLEDISLQKVHAVLAIDRAGLVPGDGVTHQGIFDVPLLSTVPDITLYSPETFEETRDALRRSVNGEGLCAVRYPKGREEVYDRSDFSEIGDGVYCDKENAEVVIISYSRTVKAAYEAKKKLSEKYNTACVKIVKLLPLDKDAIIKACKGARLVCIAEESMRHGGMGEQIAAILSQNGIGCDTLIMAIDSFLPHGEVGDLAALCSLTPDGIAESIEKRLKNASL